MNELVHSLVNIKLYTNRLRKEMGHGMEHKLLTIEKLVDDIALRHDVSEDVNAELSWLEAAVSRIVASGKETITAKRE